LRNAALRVLQILSLNRDIIHKMIQLDCIKYIVNLLKVEGHVLSDEILEYANAMLMNMGLKVSGKLKCEEIKTELMQVLFDNLEHENP
jgi:LisH domain-containing protein ARMC9